VLDMTGTVLARGGKRSFCLRDNVCRQGVTPVYGCDNPGITAGCADDYQPDLGCQYVDVTDVADVGARFACA